MAGKVAVVTCSKGVGYGTVRELCKRGVTYVYLTSKDITIGQEAIESMKKEGIEPLFHQLDITDKNNVKEFAKYLKEKHESLDIIINNEELAPPSFTKATYEDSAQVINVNYYSMLIVQEYLFPILKDDARVINMSYIISEISNIKNTYWVERLTKDDIKVDDVNAFVEWFLDSVKNKTISDDDFVDTSLLAYRISKVAREVLSRVQQKNVAIGVSVSSLDPGLFQASYTTSSDKTMEEFIKAPVSIALDAGETVNGKYLWFDITE